MTKEDGENYSFGALSLFGDYVKGLVEAEREERIAEETPAQTTPLVQAVLAAERRQRFKLVVDNSDNDIPPAA